MDKHFANQIFEDIWKDRYQKNGETFEENLYRVADFCGTTSDEKHEFYELMASGKFFPGGRTMSNSGIGTRLTLNNCFVAGTKVLTKRGYINIEDVVPGDMVITEDGTWQEVEHVMSRDYTGDLVHLRGDALYDDIYCTPNHKFLTQHGWIRADRIFVDSSRCTSVDKLRIPDVVFEKSYDRVDIAKCYICDDDERIVHTDDDKIYIEKKCAKNMYNDHLAWSKQSLSVNQYFELTPAFRYFIGRWIGDGSITRYRGKRDPSILQIVFNAKKERDAAELCKEIGDSVFGFQCTWTETRQNVIALRWCSKLVCAYFLNEFGEKCDGKHLSQKYIGDIKIAEGLIDADGFLGTHGGGVVVLKNKGLIEWLRETLFLNGFNTYRIKKINRYKDTYRVSWAPSIGNRGLNQELHKMFHDKAQNTITTNREVLDYVKLRNLDIVENQHCTVYNLSVKNVHSYVVNGVICHNCFVSPMIPDDLNGIFETVRLGALTHQRGGGIGYDFSGLRPEGTPTSNDAIASGPVSFANVFNAQTATILQGNRRGANMGVLNVYHPDIEKFITAKSYEAGVLNHFNLSVMVDDKFMEAAQHRQEISLHWPVYDKYGHIEENMEKWKVTKVVNAGDLWNSIMKHAYDNGEPGVFFYDSMNRDNNLWYEESIVCSNPCAEYIAGTVFAGDRDSSQYGGACNLGSLMLHKFVEHPFTKNAELNLYKLGQSIHTAVRFLDNIIDINTFPSVIYENYQKRYRTIGLGYTGLADALVMLGYRYDTPEARRYVGELTEFIAYSAYAASIELAKEKGAFPGFCKEAFVQSGFLEKHKSSSKLDWNLLIGNIQAYGIRNAKLLSVAPTGTMSLVYGNNCSSGIEPIFSLEYDRKVKIGGQSEEATKTVSVQDYAYGLYQEMKSSGVEVLRDPPFVTALEISVDDHVKMLAAIAHNVDMSVSKTINVPTDYPYEKCKDIYVQCWKSGIKGCTIFRPNALRKGVLLAHDDSTDSQCEVNSLDRGEVICCDDSLIGIKKKLNTGCGSMHLMAWYDPNTRDIMEVFVGRGSSGGCEKNLTAMTRLISAGLRGGISFDYIVDQLNSCGGCSAYQARRVSKHDTSPGSSCATAIALALVEMQQQIKNGTMDKTMIFHPAEQDKIESSMDTSPKCPECGAELSFEGGCNICKSCGWSKCG